MHSIIHRITTILTIPFTVTTCHDVILFDQNMRKKFVLMANSAVWSRVRFFLYAASQWQTMKKVFIPKGRSKSSFSFASLLHIQTVRFFTHKKKLSHLSNKWVRIIKNGETVATAWLLLLFSVYASSEWRRILLTSLSFFHNFQERWKKKYGLILFSFRWIMRSLPSLKLPWSY